VIDTAKLFYIRDTRQTVGNCALWWGPAGHGYTCDLKTAGRFTEAEVKRFCDRPSDVAYPAAEVDALAVLHVRFESLAGLQVEKV
jgi:hypothetical protein